MATSYNLLSCEEIGLPNRYGVSGTNFNTFFINGAIKLDGETYLLERNNQAFFPYVFQAIESQQVSLGLTVLKYNGEDILLGSPAIAYTSNELLVDFINPFSIPPVDFTDYTVGLVNAVFGINGNTGQPVTATTWLNSVIGSLLPQVYIGRSHNTFPGDTFSNFVVEKPELDTLDFTVSKFVSSTITEYRYLFNGSSAYYFVDGVLTDVFALNGADYYVTNNKAVRQTQFYYELAEPATGCPCQECSFCFMLKNCKTGELLFTGSDLTEEVGNVIKIDDSDNCYEVFECQEKVQVEVVDSYAYCKSCLPTCTSPNCR